MSHEKAAIMFNYIGVLTTMALVLSLCKAECPPRNGAVDFDLNKLSGDWFVVSATPPNGQSLSKCGRLSVTATSLDTFTMNYMALGARRNSSVTFIVNAKLDKDITGTWQLQRSSRILGPYKHRVIAVDYSSFFVLIVCGDAGGGLGVHEFAMICGREKTLSPTILDELKDKVGFYVDKSKILDVDHSGC